MCVSQKVNFNKIVQKCIFFIHDCFQKKNDLKPYVANIVCKSWNEKKMLLKLVVQRTLSPMYQAPEQELITHNKLPSENQGQIGGKMSQHSHSMSSLRKASISAPHHSQTGLLWSIIKYLKIVKISWLHALLELNVIQF